MEKYTPSNIFVPGGSSISIIKGNGGLTFRRGHLTHI